MDATGAARGAFGDAQERYTSRKIEETMIGGGFLASGARPCPDVRRQLQLSVGTIPEASAPCEQPCSPRAPLSVPSVCLALEDEAGPCTPERTAEPQSQCGCWGSWEVPCSAEDSPLKQGSPARRPAGRRRQRAAIMAALLSIAFISVLLAATAWPFLGTPPVDPHAYLMPCGG